MNKTQKIGIYLFIVGLLLVFISMAVDTLFHINTIDLFMLPVIISIALGVFLFLYGRPDLTVRVVR